MQILPRNNLSISELHVERCLTDVMDDCRKDLGSELTLMSSFLVSDENSHWNTCSLSGRQNWRHTNSTLHGNTV